MERLDRVSAIEPGFPHAMLRSPFVHNFLHGGTWNQIDPHEYDPKR